MKMLTGWTYYVFDNGIPLPARREGEYGHPQIWSCGKWNDYESSSWYEHAESITNAEFNALCKEYDVPESDYAK